jgi:hypothetical protein
MPDRVDLFGRVADLERRVEGLRQLLGRLLAGAFVVVLVAFGYAVWQSYEGRRDVVASQRRACENVSKPRDGLNARGWRQAQRRAYSAWAKAGRLPRAVSTDSQAVGTYGQIARFLEGRQGARADCVTRFPSASLLP